MDSNNRQKQKSNEKNKSWKNKKILRQFRNKPWTKQNLVFQFPKPRSFSGQFHFQISKKPIRIQAHSPDRSSREPKHRKIDLRPHNKGRPKSTSVLQFSFLPSGMPIDNPRPRRVWFLLGILDGRHARGQNLQKIWRQKYFGGKKHLVCWIECCSIEETFLWSDRSTKIFLLLFFCQLD